MSIFHFHSFSAIPLSISQSYFKWLMVIFSKLKRKFLYFYRFSVLFNSIFLK